MEMTDVADIVKPIDIPSHLKAGEIFMLNDIPYVITHVEAIADPWTHQAAMSIRLGQSDTKVVFLVMSCQDCELQIAVRYNLVDELDGWLQLKTGRQVSWLCPSCREVHGL